MKFFHLSDLHIGLKLYNRYLYEDQLYIFKQICSYAKKERPDAIVIAGDIYDKAVPPAEAVALFDRFISDLSASVPDMEIMMISGNHDSAPRLNVFRYLLERHHVHMIGLPPMKPCDFIEKVRLYDEYGPINFYLLPFVKPSMIKEITGSDKNGNNLSYNEAVHRLFQREAIDCAERNILVSHQFYLPINVNSADIERMDSEIKTVGNIDEIKSDVLAPFDYAALGHIHKPMKVGCDYYRYSGTPVAYSVSEASQEKSIIMVEIGQKGTLQTSTLPLSPLHQVRIIRGPLEDVLSHPCSDYVTVILTDRTDLDIMDTQDRLRYAFPNLLEIRREQIYTPDYQNSILDSKQMDAFELCTAFLRDTTEDEQQLLRDVINSIQEAQE